MDAPLLVTKLFVPQPRSGLVPRPRLMESLQTALSRTLVLVIAPPGFGKTTVVSQWVHQPKLEMHATWLSLDEGDNDILRFWDYFIAARWKGRESVSKSRAQFQRAQLSIGKPMDLSTLQAW
jgi:LuxR family transcriptional regulator, maltose regulon positive regulatory protein